MSSELFDAVADFLQYCGMNSTLSVFQSERLSCPPLEEIARRRNDAAAEFKRDLINSLTTGDAHRFRSLWGSRWSAPPDGAAQNLLFLSEVFFAVFPLHPANRVKFGDISDSLRHFKEFLNSNQHHVSQSVEFLPYYALPYVSNPSEHPSFRQLFSVAWFDDLRRRLSDWLDRQIGGSQVPLLITALRSPSEQMVSTGTELWEAVLELADALQLAMSGTPRPREYIDALYSRIGIFPGGAVKFTAVIDFAPLDFKKIAKDLRTPDKAAPLFKACVMRLTRAPGEHARRFFVELIGGDILQIREDISAFIRSPGPVRAYVLKLMNIIATDPPGRRYLLRSKDLIEKMVTLIRSLLDPLSEENSSYLDNSIGILQKLSLLNHVRPEMIDKGLLDVCLELLSEPNRLSLYAIDYTAALFENLCRRKAAATRCIDNDALNTLTDLYEVDVPLADKGSLQNSITRALRSLFSMEPRLRAKAQELGSDAVIRELAKKHPELAEHVAVLLDAMAKEGEDPDDDQEDEDEGGAGDDGYEEVDDGNWDFDTEGEALLALYVSTTDEANQARARIDTALRQSAGSLSGSLRGRRSTGRSPRSPRPSGS
jgi:hypothetical protein